MVVTLLSIGTTNSFVSGFTVYKTGPVVGLPAGFPALRAEPPSDNNQEKKKIPAPGNLFGNLYDSKIPPELEKEIYEAESRTATAQGRQQRVALYTGLAIFGLLAAFFNAFLTELRTSPGPDGIVLDLEATGFGWVEGNPLTSFFFLNWIGGASLLLIGGASGLLAEAEYDTRRLNAERIFEEMQRRREMRSKPARKSGKKKRQKKSLRALAEVALPDENPASGAPDNISEASYSKQAVERETTGSTKPSNDGMLGKVKDFYEKADTMAETQALLLNKKLEDEGILEKITDESGLKVIGKKEASQKKGDKES